MATTDGSVIGHTQIWGSTPRNHAFNIVLLAEGFTAAEQGAFNTACTAFASALWATQPFDRLEPAINIFRVNVSSTDSGADDPVATGGTGAMVRTYFDASFGNNGIRRLLLCNATTALTVAAARIPEFTVALVVVNSTVYGGGGGSVATYSLAAGATEIALHEMGHTAFHFADEYALFAGGSETGHDHHPAVEPPEPNVTTNTNRATLKWGAVVAATTALPTMANPDCARVDSRPSTVPAGTVGLFEGAHYFHCGAYRPEYTCKMQVLGVPFCRVCSDVISRQIAPLLAATRISVLRANGDALVKEGSLSAGWITEHTQVSQVALSGNRIAVLRTSGEALVKEGGLSTAWTSEHTDVKQVALSGNRIGVLRGNGEALVKEGGLSTGWITEHTDVIQLALYGKRIAVLRGNGEALVKDGDLSAGWTSEHTNVIQIALYGNRIAILRANGEALVKEGGLSTGWTTEHTDVKQVALSGNRIAVLRANGDALVKEGGLSAGWTTVHTDVKQLALAGKRIAVLRTNGEALVKDGDISAGWTTEHTGVDQVGLSH